MSAFICDAVRTPIGRYGGALSSMRPDDLAAHVIKALISRNPNVDPYKIDEVVFGAANQAGEDNRNVARMATLLAGLPVDVPAITVNRLCASGMDAVISASRGLRTGDHQLVIAGGVESMSRAPFILPKSDSAFSRKNEIYDSTIGWRFVNPLMKAAHGVDSMPQTAENVAIDFNISRADQDAFAMRSQKRWADAHANNIFKHEIVPVLVSQNRGEPKIFDIDEHPRSDTTLERLKQLDGVNDQKSTITAGNASGINDGAAALLLATADAIDSYKLKPLTRIIATAASGVSPRLMGIGPVSAIEKALEMTGLVIADMDLIEINEAFAAQSIACLRELGIKDHAPHVNPNGGAIALGHPLGMSGARLVLTASYELKRRRGRFALCTMCVGVGQGVAVILEAC